MLIFVLSQWKGFTVAADSREDFKRFQCMLRLLQGENRVCVTYLLVELHNGDKIWKYMVTICVMKCDF